MRSPSTPAVRVASSLDTLIVLSRSLPVANGERLLIDALDLLLAGIGCAQGAAYRAGSGALELVGERGLPEPLRSSLRRLPLSGVPWFTAQKAALRRKPVFDRDLATGEGPLDRGALALARWGQAAACPIAGDHLHAVLVFAWPPCEEPVCAALEVVEIACGMIAAHLDLRDARRAEPRPAATRAQPSVPLGGLAADFAEELGVRLAEVGRGVDEERRIARSLQGRLARYEGGRGAADLAAPRAADAGRALAAASESVSRFRAAIQPAAPARLDLAALAADVLGLAAPHLGRHRIDVTLDAPGEHWVVGRRNELMQLLVHLLLGAAGPREDEAEVASDPCAMIPRGFKLEVRRRERYVVVRLRDEGTGARSSFFDAPSEASCDLALVRRVVFTHEGHIGVEPGAGSSDRGEHWSVALPAVPGELERRALRPTLPRSALDGRARPVLVWIDEDELFLEIVVHALPELDVRVARSAAEATQLFAFGVDPALVLCNARLPDRPGHELHAELEARSPRIGARFAFVADGALTPEIVGELMSSGRPVLKRPIDLDQVRALALQEDRPPARPEAPAPEQVDPRRAATAPALRAVRVAVDGVSAAPAPPSVSQVGAEGVSPPRPRGPTTDPPPTPVTHGVPRSAMRERELEAVARALAETLRREGPKRGAAVSATLRSRGLSEPEALSVLSFALSRRILVREPPPSMMLKVPDVQGPRTVLVVDDDVDLCQTVREVLEDEGYGVDTAANGREALDRLLCGDPPRVVLLDLMMPVMDGWTVLETLGRDAALSRIPVIVISAGKTGGVQAARGHEFLGKPLDYHALLATVDRSMRLCAAAP